MNTKLARLKRLQVKIDAIRQELEFSQPGQLIFQATPDGISADIVIVEADGSGGATTSIVEGNYPLDYATKFERSFPKENEAIDVAQELAFQGASARQTLGEPA